MRRFPVCLVVFVAVVAALAAGLADCEKSEPAAQAGPVVCRLAYTAKGYYAPEFLASRRGWFAAKGVTVHDVPLGMSAGIAGAEALVSGSADVAVMGDVPALIALASRRDCVLVAAYGGGEAMHTIIAGPKAPLSAPADLVGKRLGVQFGSSTHGAVYGYLSKNGIDPAQVTLVNMPQKDLIDGLTSGSLDALAASEPTPTLALATVPGSHAVACLSGLGNDSPLVIVATRAFATAHPAAIRAVIRGTEKAVAWINADPAAAGVATAAVTGAPATVETAMFRKMAWKVRLDDQVIDSLTLTANFLHRIGKLAQVPDVRAHICPVLGEMAPAGGQGPAAR